MHIVHVSETGLIVSRNEEGFLLTDPLVDAPIQWCDGLEELKRIIEQIELNPFKVGDKVRLKQHHEYEVGTFDTVHYIGNNGAMCLEFYDDGISACVYTWEDLEAYEGKS